MKRIFFSLTMFSLISLCACGNNGGEVDDGAVEESNDPIANYDYTPAVNPVASEEIEASIGGVVEVATADSSIQGAKLTIPANALISDKTITIGEVVNPPELPLGLNFVGAPIDLGPDGLIFMRPLKIEIPYSDEALSDAGVSNDVALKLYSYNRALKIWVQEKVISVDTNNMGAREPISAALTAQQRESIISYVESQIGKPYAKAETAFGLLGGAFVKGPSSFNCVGLAEKAYENANVNSGEGLVSATNEILLLTPSEQYNNTKPAGGINPSPTVEEAALTPNSGTECTQVITEASVSHTYGLSYIDSVAYVTDDGYTNPALSFNDSGIRGDSVAGDGTYTLRADVGGRASRGEEVFIVTVTDKYGVTDFVNLLFTYTGTCRTDGGAP